MYILLYHIALVIDLNFTKSCKSSAN